MAVARALYEAPDLSFAELWCPPDDPEWGEDNLVTRTIVALPATPVWQRHEGGPRQLFTQNNVVFHHPGSEYRRERFHDVGYRCLFLVPSASLARHVAAEIDPASAETPAITLPASAPLDSRTFLLSRLAACALRSQGGDSSSAREVLYEVLYRALGASRPGTSRPPAASPATERARRELVEEAKHALTANVAEPVSLDDLARGLYTSPFHLARLFRSSTGFSVHGYLVQLRLRMALDRIQHGPRDIGGVGLAVGFNSHSHFTASFRRAFGLTPSGLLGAAGPVF